MTSAIIGVQIPVSVHHINENCHYTSTLGIHVYDTKLFLPATFR